MCLNGAAAVQGLVPVGYDGAINLMAVQQNSPSRLTITYYQKKNKKLTELYAAPLPKCYRAINQ